MLQFVGPAAVQFILKIQIFLRALVLVVIQNIIRCITIAEYCNYNPSGMWMIAVISFHIISWHVLVGLLERIMRIMVAERGLITGRVQRQV